MVRKATDTAPTIELAEELSNEEIDQAIDLDAEEEAEAVTPISRTNTANTPAAPDTRKPMEVLTFDAQGRTTGMPSQGGSESTWTDEERAAICEEISGGLSRTWACKVVGRSMDSLRQEIARNLEFGKRLDLAEALCMKHHLTRVREGASGWQSAAWFLERKFRKEFSLGSPDPDEGDREVRIRKVIRGSTPRPGG